MRKLDRCCLEPKPVNSNWRKKANSSYHVWEESNRFYFETDYSLKYFVDFTKEDNPKFTAYWFLERPVNKNAITSKP